MRAVENGSVKLTPFSEVRFSDRGEGFDISSPLSRKVREIISDTLAANEADIEADTHVLNDLGADSLQYFSLISRLAEEFGITGYDETDEYCYTLREFCQYIERHID